MAATAASDVSDGPVLNFINKRLRALKKKQNRILQMEEAIAQGKILNKEQEDVLRSKPSVTASIDELEKLRQPLSVAVADEISLALQRHQVSASPPVESTVTKDDKETEVEQKITVVEHQSDHGNTVVEDLLNLLYFGTMFDVRTASDFTSTILTRTHERGCCLTYDYVTDDESTDMLGERDLDLISTLGGLLVSRPVDSNLSHKNALRRCMEHAKLWLANSDQPIDPDSNITYAALRARLNKIMASDYFTTTPEMKAAVEVAAAAGNYALHGSMVPVNVPVQVEGSDVEYQQKDEDTANFQENESYDDQSSPVEEFHKSESEVENHAEVSAQTEPVKSQEEMGQNQREVETKEQNHVPRRAYQNQRGGRGGGGGGRRGYSNGRGGRYGGRGGGPYQNGRSQYYDQPGNYYPRNYAYNRGRGGRGGGGGGGNSNYNHGSGGQAGNDPADS